MSYNWNVYKLFSNGNRAKAPFAVVESEDCESEGFNAMVRKNLEEIISIVLGKCFSTILVLKTYTLTYGNKSI